MEADRPVFVLLYVVGRSDGCGSNQLSCSSDLAVLLRALALVVALLPVILVLAGVPPAAVLIMNWTSKNETSWEGLHEKSPVCSQKAKLDLPRKEVGGFTVGML